MTTEQLTPSQVRMQAFVEVYTEELWKDWQAHAENLRPGVTEQTAAARARVMVSGMAQKQALIESPAIKRSCAKLGIKHRYGAIASYLNGAPDGWQAPAGSQKPKLKR